MPVDTKKDMIGFSCAYTPLPLIDAAGFTPYRIFPVTESLDQAGSIMHDNMCSHVKRVLDRGMATDLPHLAGVVFMNSCESMRRLSDAWKVVRPNDRQVIVDLPSTADLTSITFLARQLSLLWNTLREWSGMDVVEENIVQSVKRYNELANKLAELNKAVHSNGQKGDLKRLQRILNSSVTFPIEKTLTEIDNLKDKLAEREASPTGIPVYLFGNVLPDEEAFELLEISGCRIVGDSLCTGSRQIVPINYKDKGDPFLQLARALLNRPQCARTVTPDNPGGLATYILKEAQQCGAVGVIAHVMKFCDPYLGRIPAVREALEESGIPILVLEGDCTLRSLGQSRTRIEAFVEMLERKTP